MKYLSKLKLAGLFCLSLLFTLFTFTVQVNASANLTKLPFYWDAIDVELDVRDNGDMLVTETQTYVFNQEHTNQRYRYIPLDRVDKITDVTVTENNSVIPSQTGKDSNQLWIKWQHELNPPELHTFVIKYRVVGGLRVNNNNARVYWKAIFGDRNSPVQNAKVTVRVPESVEKINSFSHYASNVTVTSEQIGNSTVEFIAREPIPQGRELEVKVGFPNNTGIEKPEWQQSGIFNKSRAELTEGILEILIVLTISLLIHLWLGKPPSGGNSSGSGSNSHSYHGGYYGGGSGGGGGG